MAVLAKCRIPCYRRACVAVSMLLRLQYQIAKHAEIIQYSGLLLTQFLSVTINAMFWTIMNSWESVKVECMTTSLLVVILAYTIQNRWSLIVYWVTYFSLLIAHSNGTQITPLVHPTHPITITIFFPLAVMCSNVFWGEMPRSIQMTMTLFVSLIGLKRNGCDYIQITKK